MHSEKRSHHIGMFDSGLGGLTVLQQLRSVLPCESIIYFGDTARVPYGEKSPDTIIRYSLENASFLMDKQIKMLVVACNTVSSYALEHLKDMCDIPVIGVIEPGAQKAVEETKNQHIAVLGTTATIRSGMYEREILKRLPKAKIFPVACPLFVPLVEEQFLNHAASRLIVKEYLHVLHGKNIDTVLLGCTHYPLLRHLIQEELGPDITIVDSAKSCAESVANILKSKEIECAAHQVPKYQYFVSDDPIFFRTKSRGFLGDSIDHVESTKV